MENPFVEGGEEAKNLGADRVDDDSGEGVPEEEFVDCGFGDGALAPSDFRVQKVSDDGREASGNESSEPKEVAAAKYDHGEKSVNQVVEYGNGEADGDVSEFLVHNFIILYFVI